MMMLKQHFIHLIIYFALLVSLSTTCANAGVFSSLKGAFAQNTPSDNNSATLLDMARSGRLHIAEPEDVTENADLLDDTTTTLSQVIPLTGQYFIREFPELQDYIKTIAMKLLENWPGKPPADISVHIAITPDFVAIADSSGSIVISIGALDTLKSEDELAAVLGHELSHILLNHSEVAESRHFLGSILKTGEAFAKSHAINSSANAASQVLDFGKYKIAQWTINAGLFPQWSRKQERDADRLGTDLIVAAGYNPDAAIIFLNKLATVEDYRKQIFLDEIVKSKGGEEYIDLNSVFTSIDKSLASWLGKDHDSATDRSVFIRKYIRTHYRNSRHDALKTREYEIAVSNPKYQRIIKGYISAFRFEHGYVTSDGSDEDAKKMAQQISSALSLLGKDDPYINTLLAYHYLISGNSNKGIEYLKLSVASGRAPISTYDLLFRNCIEHNEMECAKQILDMAATRFGDDITFLYPHRILLASRTNYDSTSTSLKCVGTIDIDLINRCRKAEKGIAWW